MLAALAIGLAAVAVWVRQVAQLVAATPSAQFFAPGASVDPGHQLRILVKGTLALTLTLMAMLVLMGVFVTVRDWWRRPHAGRARQTTEYVDAWKLAAERFNNDLDTE